MRALIDTNILLDLLLDRPEFIKEATAIWDGNRTQKFEGYISAISPVNVFYIARRIKGIDYAHQAVGQLLDNWKIADITSTVLISAYKLSFSDFEDAVQHSSADALHLDCIVTRNIDHYRQATLAVYSPVDFLARLQTPQP